MKKETEQQGKELFEWVKASEEFPKNKIWRVKYDAIGSHSIDSSKYDWHDEQNIYFYGAEPLLLTNVEWLKPFKLINQQGNGSDAVEEG